MITIFNQEKVNKLKRLNLIRFHFLNWIMTIFNQQRKRKMSILSNIKDIYNSIPKQEPVKQVITPLDPDLLGKTLDHLNQQPQIAPNITRKPET